MKAVFKFLGYLLGVVIIVLGSICSFNLYKIYTAQSDVVGSIKYETIAENAVFHFDFGKSVAFYPDSTKSKYSVSMTTDKVDFNGDKGRFVLYLNDKPCAMVFVRAGLVQAQAEYEFYATDGTTAANLVLDFSIAFYSDKTVVEVTTKSGGDALGYFVHMTESEGFKIELRQETAITEVI